MSAKTNVPCFPLMPETGAPCNPLYPITTVCYNERMKAIEVTFGGPDHSVIHILTPDRAMCLAKLLSTAAMEATVKNQLTKFFQLEGAETWRTQGDGHFSTVEEIEAEYPRNPREAEGA